MIFDIVCQIDALLFLHLPEKVISLLSPPPVTNSALNPPFTVSANSTVPNVRVFQKK